VNTILSLSQDSGCWSCTQLVRWVLVWLRDKMVFTTHISKDEGSLDIGSLELFEDFRGLKLHLFEDFRPQKIK
jgi:hypothetical protein